MTSGYKNMLRITRRLQKGASSCVLGYAKHEKLLLLMGIFLMPMFLLLYYYNLDISLMTKSGILIGSGLILLAGRAYLVMKKLDREAL